MKGNFRERLGRLMGRKPPEIQVAALCLDSSNGKVLLVTSRGTGRWIVPKGWPMPGISLADAALQEAWEEAGVRGKVNQNSIGRYKYDKEQDRGFSIPIEVHVYQVDVKSLADDFLEVKERKRRWYKPERAAELVAESGLKEMLRALPSKREQKA
ncbi:NUDIX hydrolase [Paracoccus sp. MBLB3053]|uniref:NUDIX hydrolase n=1 Tax=Paracoccus aurantius TaxID=3073814 RepID=A0ABU2HQF0_9RHOB|nr:NUDIX hydrolase [Paracoccus sp. MBLB3053]MDS9466519.1 NUDIX hydrolase [Paracoccus sp. MBLB3053]